MQVGIAGAGAIALGYCALLQQRGHKPCLWSPSGKRTLSFKQGAALRVQGALEGDFNVTVCDSAQELALNDVIVLALPANGHRAVVDAIAPHLEARHCVIISAHLSFAALYLSKILAKRGIQIPIVAWNTTMLTAKSKSSTEINVGAIRSKVEMATVPSEVAEPAHRVCTELFGELFVIKDDILTIALSNINPQNHLAIALCNLTRIDRGENWGQRVNVTPTVGRLIEALDMERLSIATALGKKVHTVIDHYVSSFAASGSSIFEMSKRLVRNGKDFPGPTSIETRYVLEDVPFGLIPITHLASLVGVEVPLHRSGIQLLAACYGRDFASDNGLFSEIDVDDLSAFKALIAKGYGLEAAA
ncbi:NAD/NADP octopine/nopaline dehydrogenase [Agrobacterium tumefaciens]|uniref:NAD/NADP octopine/nopaline dehydrogenase family protein n=1 Tax=Agrobacterium tumefaciens TaxID=358 RepID=UPI001572CD76|nr:NAD/NADP octopine/nopaline dehydrogenase family protein [Agrobacterium tumefaciens]NSX84358.1 NAD/NADP octopine/nopaline dehydrogenase [Agrobacterium tumefaciens]NTA50007.1 NAD/NADP octopine/nopaline dehydrogenase [Agrobacterium tumefaciens]